ncbi:MULTISPECIES: hypothetical protein [Nocardiopsis]|uniref:Uncharacterized protein n=1 Tax=Nocardiopsis sinuspersici TaxID=501010 RepID=A0A1V3BZY1_9ACTN|nr:MULTISPECIES: hypothetical protein [Nocardiopsis]OOC53796.1 hypothetical protein NOSIN_08255 [Nocardiopsis sinuspersici]
MAQCGATVREIADLLGVHPHHPDEDALRRLPELPTRVLIGLARRLDLHPADLAPGLEPVLVHTRQDTEPDSEDPAIEADARTVLAALAHAGTPVAHPPLCQVLDWPHPRLRTALDHLQDHPEAAGLAAHAVEGELAVDPAVRFSLLPEHSPSAEEETEEEH